MSELTNDRLNTLIPLWDIPGGIHPPQNKTQSTQLPLVSLAIPPQLIIPLNQHIGAAAKPLVKPGDKVLAGELIGAADGIFSANIHASSSGTVVAIEERAIPHPSGMRALSVVIATDNKHEKTNFDACANYLALEPLALLKKIREAGIAGLGGAGFPTSVKLSIKSTQTIDVLIINGAECEPYITADDLLMQTHAEDIIAGVYLLSHILRHPTRLVIGVEDNKPKAINALRTALQEFNGLKSPDDAAAEIISIPTKYPSGGAKQITQIITGREIPQGHHSADVGVICLNVGTLVAAWRAVRFGEPLISRITTLVGEALEIQRNVQVLIGTPIDFVLAQHGFDASKALRVIMGGSLMGFTLPDLQAPVIKTTNCILAASKKELPLPPPAQACIRCGLCSEVCPASLLPQQLFWYAQAEDTDRLQAYHLFDCIECGACSYVCPSKIPLVQYYRAAKGQIRQQDADKERADHSRQRFEFRQQRFAKEEAAKELKRIARKQAADEARQKLAEKKLAISTIKEDSQPAQPNPVIEAVTTSNANQPGFEEQQARLERVLGAARNSLASAQEPLVPRNREIPITDEQRIKQQARIKQAELKLAEAEKKLAEFLASANPGGNDPLSAAMSRVQEKLSQSPEQRLQANLESLRTRLLSAQEKADQAKAENAATANALQKGADNIRVKIAQLEAELNEITNATPADKQAESQRAEQLAATRAIARAAEKITQQAAMNDEEKREQEIQTLKLRLQKAQVRLATAEAEDDNNLEIFKLAVKKLEEKLKEL